MKAIACNVEYGDMISALKEPLCIGSLVLPHRLIQGPLAGFSAAPFRVLFDRFFSPAYCVSEMISAHDVMHRHTDASRYLYRSPDEARLCYQVSGRDPVVMANAALRLARLGANLVDINAGCPKLKIRKKGAGSALMETPELLSRIVFAVRQAVTIPLTVKMRLFGDERDIDLAHRLCDAGADALIIHARRWTDDYHIPADYAHVLSIKKSIRIPIIANGDVTDEATLAHAVTHCAADAYMISRAGCGRPWLYQQLLAPDCFSGVENKQIVDCFLTHLQGLATLESEHQAMLQSKTLVRYYFRHQLTVSQLQHFYRLDRLQDVVPFLAGCMDC